MSTSAKKPFVESEVAAYEKKRYRGLDQRLVHRREIKLLEKALRLVAGEAPTPEPLLALDAPCGYGRFSELLWSAGFRPVSCDLSAAMVKRALAKGRSPTMPMGIVANLPEGLPFREGVFALVFSLRFFHHLHRSAERRAALSEFARVAAAWLILSYYQANPLHLAQRALRRRLAGKKTKIKMIARRVFKDEADAAGFRIVRVFPLFRGIHGQHIALLKKTDAG
jgi:SAM-dependent methyltransferase